VVIPGDAIERAALGYLHVNCGVSCHNGVAQEPLAPALRLESERLTRVQDTPAFQSALNRSPGLAAQIFTLGMGGPFYDIRPCDPGRSLVVVRMAASSRPLRMPMEGSARVDDLGVRAVSAWIEAMTPARGYPPAKP
jgi:hypothetical protein